MKRFFKQTFIAAIYLLLFGGALWGLWSYMYPAPAPCPTCEIIKKLSLPVTVRKVTFTGQSGNTVDVGFQVRNPNPNWGIEDFSYRVDFKDPQGKVLPGSLYSSGFLMPGQTRWIMELGKFVPVFSSYEMVISTSTMQWQKMQPYVTEHDFVIQNPILKKLVAPAAGYAEVTGSLTNHSQFDAANVEIQAVVYDSKKSIIAIGNTTMQLLRQGETRNFRVFWARPFSGTDASFDTFVNVNLMQDQNFLQKYRQQ